jgi:hypothetical protein
MRWFVIVDDSDWGGDVVNEFANQQDVIAFITDAMNEEDPVALEYFHVIEGKEYPLHETARVKLGDPES